MLLIATMNNIFLCTRSAHCCRILLLLRDTRRRDLENQVSAVFCGELPENNRSAFLCLMAQLVQHYAGVFNVMLPAATQFRVSDALFAMKQREDAHVPLEAHRFLLSSIDGIHLHKLIWEITKHDRLAARYGTILHYTGTECIQNRRKDTLCIGESLKSDVSPVIWGRLGLWTFRCADQRCKPAGHLFNAFKRLSHAPGCLGSMLNLVHLPPYRNRVKWGVETVSSLQHLPSINGPKGYTPLWLGHFINTSTSSTHMPPLYSHRAPFGSGTILLQTTLKRPK